MMRIALVVIAIGATIGIGVILVRAPASAIAPVQRWRWCCLEDTETGFGTCSRGERECLQPSAYRSSERKFRSSTQERAACFESTTTAGVTLEDCNPTVATCERSRAKALMERVEVGECLARAANSPH
jgi:hypothetical protein